MIIHRTARKMFNALLGGHPASAEGRAIAVVQRQPDEGPMSVIHAANARRDAEYLARRNGLKEPLLQLWKVN
ncbi:hypothetical protein ACR80S_03660 [Halomonas sp. MA07-2]|uniref:hypothetical protein n=1 Tax=unclassified Halomonas TaxID=2609666 RepID=UPI003EEE4754